MALGAEDVDAALRGGLRRDALHEVAAGDESAAAAGFCAAVLAKLAGERGVVVWCGRGRDLYGPGLAAFGLDPARLIVVQARREREILWVMEEGLRSRVPAAVLGELEDGGSIAQRRLQLAAESGGVSAILLRPHGARRCCGPVLTRWRIAAAQDRSALETAHGLVFPHPRWPHPRWRVALQRCRGGIPATWLLEWRYETGGFAVAPELRHRPARPARPAARSGQGAGERGRERPEERILARTAAP